MKGEPGCFGERSSEEEQKQRLCLFDVSDMQTASEKVHWMVV